ncbi:MAG: GtrA family protein [Polyangiaceae bacterium]|nr:GtrA family protein [Polyangiaceae bacterium]
MLEQLREWFVGDPSDGTTLASFGSTVVIAAYFLLGLPIFLLRVAVRGLPRDAETEKRGRSLLVGFFLRHYFFWVTRPLSAGLLWSGVPADAITTFSLLLGVGAGVAVAAGQFALGGTLFLLAGILDAMDGRVARARNEATSAGAALDSVLDRYTDSAVLIGLAWYYRSTWVLLPVLAALLGTSLVPYVRARGEGLGISIRGGVMQRLERVLFLGAPLALCPIVEALLVPRAQQAMHWPAVAAIVFVGVLSNATAIFRLVSLMRALGARLTAVAGRPIGSQLGMHLFAAAAATFADYALVSVLVEHLGLPAAEATALGCVAGGALNYSLNRALTFFSKDPKLPQIGRYALVSGTSAALNAGGVALAALHPALDYRIAWWLTRAVVYVAWNFPLQRGYVFAPQPGASSGPHPAPTAGMQAVPGSHSTAGSVL